MQKQSKYILLISCLFITLSLLAHEFWLQPNKYFFTIYEIANIRFNVGEDFTGENWKGNKNRIQQLIHYTPDKKQIDISNKLSDAEGDSLQLPILQEGTHMVIYNSINSFIQLEAKKFNDYLTEDGITNTLEYRKANYELDSIGTEYYQRSVKTILQCGTTTTDACTKPTSLPLDIVPEINPYEAVSSYNINNGIGADNNNRFRIIFKSNPLGKVLVKHWYKKTNGSFTHDDLYANKKGWVSLLQKTGPNMVSCVYMEKNTIDSKAKWQSYWASVTFEIKKGNYFIKKR